MATPAPVTDLHKNWKSLGEAFAFYSKLASLHHVTEVEEVKRILSATEEKMWSACIALQGPTIQRNITPETSSDLQSIRPSEHNFSVDDPITTPHDEALRNTVTQWVESVSTASSILRPASCKKSRPKRRSVLSPMPTKSERISKSKGISKSKRISKSKIPMNIDRARQNPSLRSGVSPTR